VKETIFNGWIRGFMTGAWYAFMCSSDFIYIEQDCLVIGKDWVQALYKKSDGRFPLYGGKFRHPIQQSLVFVPCRVIPRLLYVLCSIKQAMTCETRFHHSSVVKQGVPYKKLPFGVGRVRPINWDAKWLYAQHWSVDELIQLGKREGVNGMIKKLLEAGGTSA
jgi:hypothetical protein